MVFFPEEAGLGELVGECLFEAIGDDGDAVAVSFSAPDGEEAALEIEVFDA